jgi:hypothetical protein
MLHGFMDAFRQVLSDLARQLEPETMAQLCRSARYRWRERVLHPVTTSHLFVLQVLHGNVTCSALPH